MNPRPLCYETWNLGSARTANLVRKNIIGLNFGLSDNREGPKATRGHLVVKCEAINT